MQLEDKQKTLGDKLQMFVDENERIRQQLYHRDRQAELKTRINNDVLKASDNELRRSQSPVRKSRSNSPLRNPKVIR